MMVRYEIRNADDQGLAGIVTDQAVVYLDDRATGTAWVSESDSLGRRKAKGVRVEVGVDPLLERPLVLVTMGLDGLEIRRDEMPERGEPDPAHVEVPVPPNG